ncbi:AsmA family protein [Crocinitomicaceae bacterium]|nr:AsmA family protein [Crocinitomicaceae bacterium]
MKKILPKALKWLGIVIATLLVLFLLIPVFFKDQIKSLIIEEANKELNAKLGIKDFDVTFISTFPNMTVQLHETTITGKDKFKDVELINIETLTAHLSFWDVVSGNQIEIDEIHLNNPKIDLRILEDGKANYDILKTTEEKTDEELSEPANFKLSLNEYSITNGTIKYNDQPYDMHTELININHTGKGDFTANDINFITSTTIDKLTYEMEGIRYLTEVKTYAAIDLFINFTDASTKVTMKKNTIALNNLVFSLNGFYQMFNEFDDMDLTVDASQASFKDFLSLVPTFYHSGYESMISSGQMELNASINGKMDDNNFPGWDFGIHVKNGSIKYPDLKKITNIQIDANNKFPGGEDLNEMTFKIPSFHANLSKNTFDASLFMSHLMSDPFIQSSLKARIDLASIKEFIPLEDGERYAGILDADIAIHGKLSALDAEDYEAFKATGVMELSDLNYATSAFNKELQINQMKLSFSPEHLTLNAMDAIIGNSDIKMNGAIGNYFGYLLRNDELTGDFVFKSDRLDLDELMGIYPEEVTEGTANGEGNQSEGAASEPTLVPDNIDFKLATTIKEVKYNGITAKTINGTIRLKDEVAELNELSMFTMGGNIDLSGNYNTKNKKEPIFDFSYVLKNLDVETLTSNFLTVGKLAPIAKYAKGKISSNFTMSSVMNNSLMPVISSISSDGDFRSNKLKITGFELLKKIEKVTRIKDFSNQTLNDFKAHFSIHDGKLLLTPFDVKMAGIETKISGYSSLDKDINYTLDMNLPREKIPASLLQEVENGLSLVNGLHPNLKVGELPAYLPINVFINGTPKNPKVSTNLKEQIALAIKSKVGGIVDDLKETIEDSVTTLINNQIDDIKTAVDEQKKAILEEAQKKADAVKLESKNAANKLRTEAKKHADQLIQEAGNNPIKKKIAEAAAKKYIEQQEKIALKIESEGAQKADAVMLKAQEKANKLG